MSVACLVLGGIHAHVWLRRREAIVTRANLAFAVLAFSVAVMGVPWRGSLLLLFLVTSVFLGSALGLLMGYHGMPGTPPARRNTFGLRRC